MSDSAGTPGASDPSPHLMEAVPDRGRSRRLFRPIVPVDEPLAARLGSPFRPYLRLLIYGILTFSLIPVQAIAVGLGLRNLAERIPLFFHRACLPVLGIRVEQRGTISARRPTLFVCNHSSYLDITVLGAFIPGCFVAKAEVAGWPLFGLLAKLQRTIFIDRRRNSTHRQRDEIAERLAAGDNLILFPEGTSNDGNRTLPFRSALLSVAEHGRNGNAPAAGLTVQPVSIAYTRLNGMPLGHGLRPLVAWYGDMVMADHLWQLLRLGKLTVVLTFNEPVTVGQFASRKALADHCHRVVAQGVAEALAGRSDPSPAVTPAAEPAAEGTADTGERPAPDEE